jgi:hypothetical protein
MCSNYLFAQLTYPFLQPEFDSAWTYKNLRLIPVRFINDGIKKPLHQSNYISLADAMQTKKAEVREHFYKGDADVHLLTIKNNSKQNIVVNSGELLEGGKQDRMIAETKIIAPGKQEDYIAANCIEQGRWSKKPKPFTHAGFADMQLRKIADSTDNQQSIWKEIQQQYKDSSKASEELPYIELHQQSWKKDEADYVKYFIDKFSKSDSSFAGFIAITDTTIIGCDLFASRELTNTSFINILHGYIHSVKKKDGDVSINKTKPIDYAEHLMGNDAKQKEFLDQHHGRMFLQDKKPLHIVAFGY